MPDENHTKIKGALINLTGGDAAAAAQAAATLRSILEQGGDAPLLTRIRQAIEQYDQRSSPAAVPAAYPEIRGMTTLTSRLGDFVFTAFVDFAGDPAMAQMRDVVAAKVEELVAPRLAVIEASGWETVRLWLERLAPVEQAGTRTVVAIRELREIARRLQLRDMTMAIGAALAKADIASVDRKMTDLLALVGSNHEDYVSFARQRAELHDSIALCQNINAAVSLPSLDLPLDRLMVVQEKPWAGALDIAGRIRQLVNAAAAILVKRLGAVNDLEQLRECMELPPRLAEKLKPALADAWSDAVERVAQGIRKAANDADYQSLALPMERMRQLADLDAGNFQWQHYHQAWKCQYEFWPDIATASPADLPEGDLLPNFRRHLEMAERARADFDAASGSREIRDTLEDLKNAYAELPGIEGLFEAYCQRLRVIDLRQAINNCNINEIMVCLEALEYTRFTNRDRANLNILLGLAQDKLQPDWDEHLDWWKDWHSACSRWLNVDIPPLLRDFIITREREQCVATLKWALPQLAAPEGFPVINDPHVIINAILSLNHGIAPAPSLKRYADYRSKVRAAWKKFAAGAPVQQLAEDICVTGIDARQDQEALHLAGWLRSRSSQEGDPTYNLPSQAEQIALLLPRRGACLLTALAERVFAMDQVDAWARYLDTVGKVLPHLADNPHRVDLSHAAVLLRFMRHLRKGDRSAAMQSLEPVSGTAPLLARIKDSLTAAADWPMLWILETSAGVSDVNSHGRDGLVRTVIAAGHAVKALTAEASLNDDAPLRRVRQRIDAVGALIKEAEIIRTLAPRVGSIERDVANVLEIFKDAETLCGLNSDLSWLKDSDPLRSEWRARWQRLREHFAAPGGGPGNGLPADIWKGANRLECVDEAVSSCRAFVQDMAVWRSAVPDDLNRPALADLLTRRLDAIRTACNRAGLQGTGAERHLLSHCRQALADDPCITHLPDSPDYAVLARRLEALKEKDEAMIMALIAMERHLTRLGTGNLSAEDARELFGFLPEAAINSSRPLHRWRLFCERDPMPRILRSHSDQLPRALIDAARHTSGMSV